MSLAVVLTRGLDGLESPPVRVEVHVGNGLPAFHVVGLAETVICEHTPWEKPGAMRTYSPNPRFP
ncbi:MAG TPA: hypothetical protein PLD37_13090, partial [Usitatibacteraceae bacterium]|nr:hypothetical protein [Usitatibacteraceae bacterium]